MGNCCSTSSDDEGKSPGDRHSPADERETNSHVRFADSSSSLSGNVSLSGGGIGPRNTSPMPLMRIERISAAVHLHSKTSPQCLMMRRLDESSFSPTRFFLDMEEFNREAPLRPSQSVEVSWPPRTPPPSPDGTAVYRAPCFNPIPQKPSVSHHSPGTPPALFDAGTVSPKSSEGFGGLQPSKEKGARKTSPHCNGSSSSDSLSGMFSPLYFIENVFGDESTGSLGAYDALPPYDHTSKEALRTKRSFQFFPFPPLDLCTRYIDVNDAPVRRATSSYNFFNREI